MRWITLHCKAIEISAYYNIQYVVMICLKLHLEFQGGGAQGGSICETQGGQGGLEESTGKPALPKLHLGCGQQTHQLGQPSSPVALASELKHT